MLTNEEIELNKRFYAMTKIKGLDILATKKDLFSGCELGEEVKQELDPRFSNARYQEFSNELMKGYVFTSIYKPYDSQYSDNALIVYAIDNNGNKITIGINKTCSVSKEEKQVKEQSHKKMFVEMADGSIYELENNGMLKYYGPETKDNRNIHGCGYVTLPNGVRFNTEVRDVEPTTILENITVNEKDVIQSGTIAISKNIVPENNGFHM